MSRQFNSGYGFMQDTGKDFARQYRNMMSQIDPWEVLNRYGAKNITEIQTKSGPQLQHSCIIDQVDPHHSHGDQSPSASLHMSKMLYCCYSFGGGDLFWLIQKMEGVVRAGVLPILSKLLGESVQTTEQFLDEIDRYFVQEERVASIPTYSEKILEPWLMIHPYMTEARGISEDVLKSHSVGYDEKEVRIVLPHFWDGKLVGWQKRRQDDPRWPMTPLEETGRWGPKYQNSHSFPKLETLYSTSQETTISGGSSVLVVESVLSVLRAETLVTSSTITRSFLMGSILTNTISTFGAKVSDTQLKLLRNYDRVVLWFDDDIAGLRATLRVCKALDNFTHVYVVQNQGARDDLAGLTEGEIEYYLTGIEPSVLVLSDIEDRLKQMEYALKKEKELSW